MKAIILGAGYGTRLEREIERDISGRYQHLRKVPKPLLPIAGKPLVDYWIERIEESKEIREVYIVTNGLNYPQFREWARGQGFPIRNLVNDGTLTNEGRLGAIGDIALVIKERRIDDDLLIVAGDTLFYPDFDLKGIIKEFYKKKSCWVTYYQLESEEEVKKRGILKIDGENRVIGFLEKPEPEETSSRLACPSLYIYRRECLGMIEEFLAQTTSLEERDAPGRLVAWLYSKVPVYGFKISGRFDVGGLENYIQANSFFMEQKDGVVLGKMSLDKVSLNRISLEGGGK